MNILITGASRGIGRALALQLAGQQARVGLVARNVRELSDLQQEITATGQRAEIYAGNVADETFVQQTVDNFVRAFGKIDALVNNAGVGLFKNAEEITAQEWDSLMDTNVKGTFLFSRAAVPHMKSAGGGHIVTVASDVAKRVFEGGSLYCATKYAQDAFSMALRKEVRRHGIKVSVVYSGLVDTHFHAHAQGDEKARTWLRDTDIA
ncbi:MAG: SDR family oxidoreductase, partial [Cytophagales bacterium]|nr:SDR family oxidoreductase [Cytophagales bacterium]